MRIKDVPLKIAAAILGKSEMFVRCGLRAGKFSFGKAITSNSNKKPYPYYSYHISVPKFKEYAGCNDDDIFRYAEKLGCILKTDE